MCTCVIILGTLLCRPLQISNVKSSNSALSGEREPRRLVFVMFISNLSICPRFSFAIALTEINKVNDFKVPRDSKVKYKVIFLTDVVLGVAVVVS